MKLNTCKYYLWVSGTKYEDSQTRYEDSCLDLNSPQNEHYCYNKVKFDSHI